LLQKIKILTSLIGIILITLAGCSNPAAPVAATKIIMVETTVTETIEPTLIVSPTLFFPPTQTVTIEPTPDLSGLMVLGAGPSNGGYLLNFQIPRIDRVYLVSIDGMPFKCEILTQYEDRLMCYGFMLQWGKTVEIEFIDPVSGQMVHSLNYTLPDHDYGFGTPAPPVCVNPFACPRRGQNFRCETELHYNPDGNPCMVSTCTDACGFCVGINTCHPH
jgi:hypothetical protein